MAGVRHQDAAASFDPLRPKLMRVAYRMDLFGTNASKLVRTGFVNGLPGFITLEADGELQATALEIEDGKIAAIYVVRNPDKLKHLH